VWGDALEVPGTAALNTYIYGSATVNAISCPSVGNCSAGGSFGFAQYGNEAFVVDQVDGVWGTAIVPPSSTEIGGYGLAPVNTISCSSAGNCSVSGTFYNPKRHTSGSNFSQIYVDSEVNGVWGDAIELPGSTVVNRGGTATVNSISCSSAGNCSVVGGLETDSGMNPKISGTFQAFVANEVNGVWNTVTEPPGSVTVNNGESAEFNSVSCTSDGNCSAGGYLQVSSTKRQAFVASENNGVWSHVIEIPGSAALNGGGDAMVNVISCASNKNCVAGGYYYANPKQREAFLADEVNGKWNRAFEVPGTASLNTSWAEVDAVSCSSTNFCSAGGKYSTRAGGYQAFVVSN
jgi:hypothetical protein